MKTKILFLLNWALFAGMVPGFGADTAFTYQGRLNDGVEPANGVYDLRFLLFDVPTNGSIIAPPITSSSIAVTGGLFAVTLDFGPGVFNGLDRWLQIDVRTNGGGSFVPLLPRQSITPTPYAIFTARAGTVTNGAIDTAQLAAGAVTRAKIASNAVDTLQLADGAVTTSKLAFGSVDTSQIANGAVTALKLASNSVTTGKIANFAVDTPELANGAVTTVKLASNAVTTAKIADFAVDTAQLAGSAVTTGKLTNEAVTTPKLANDAVTSAKVLNGTLIPADLDVDRFNTTFWRTGGNSNTTAGTHFIGTTDNEPFEIHANGNRVLRLVSNSADDEPNVIAGSSVNFVSGGATGATIAGGGSSHEGFFGLAAPNQVGGSFGTVGGGLQNRAMGYAATVVGGGGNFANGEYATVCGFNNVAGGTASFAGGFQANASHDRSVVWALGATTIYPSEESERFHIYAAQGLEVEFGGQVSGTGRGNYWVTIGSANTSTKPINTSIGAYLNLGGVWVNASDRNKKENFTPVDTRAVLEKLAALPLTTWNYKTEQPSTKHLGPMAQDFRAAFGLGNDEKGIGTVDADGVALAAIQGLNQKLMEELKRRDAENAELKQRLEALEEMILGRKSN